MQPAVDDRSQSGFFSAVRESLLGTRRDFTSGSPGRAILLLAIPMVLEMMMESLFGVVDVFFVAKLGAEALATVALTESVLTLIFGVALGLSLATTATIARRIGEKNTEGAAVAAVQAVAIGIGLSALVGICGLRFAPDLLRLMGAAPAIIQTGAGYTRILLGGSATIFLIFLINAIFRGAGDAALAMRTLWLANAINIVLDPCLINGWGPFPHLGVTGAAVATTTGRGIGVLFQLWMLFGGKSRVVIGRAQLRANWEVMWRLIRVSITGIIQFVIATASWLALVRLMSMFGSVAVAGYMIAIRLVIFVILPCWGLCNAAATLVGQNLGAGKPDRAEAAVWRTGFYNMVYMGLVSVFFIFLPEQVVGAFTADPGIARVGETCLRTIGFGNLFYAWGMVMVQAFNGAGDTVTPTLINLGCYWCFQLPLAYVLAFKMGFGPNGVFAAIPAAETALAIVSIILFRRGKWKKQTI